MRDPSDGAGERKQRCEHARREAECPQRDAGIEIDVRVELFRDEVVVLQRNPLQLQGDLEQRVVMNADLVENRMALHLHGFRARIVVFVHAVAETHQPEIVVGVLRPPDVFRNAIDGSDFLEHLERSFVGAAMRRSPQAGDARRNTSERIGAG